MTQKPLRFLRCLALFTACALFLAILPPPAEAAFSSRVIRVGLFYGSNALPTANLANEVGSGYRFGTYSDSGAFTAVGETAYEKITVCKDANLYLSGGAFYETPTAGGYTLVGAYHLQAAGSFGSYADALQAASAFPYGFPAYVNGQYVVRFEFYSSAANAAADASGYPGATVVGGSSTCYTVVDTASGQILFEFDGGEGAYLAIEPKASGSQLAQTWFKGYQYYGGFQYMRRSGNDLSVVNFVSEDLYVSGVLPYEFVASGSLESLKAGAVAVRTFARRSTKHRSLGFDICNTTDCQVYRGVYTGSGAQTVLQAVEETAGECAYYQGTLIEALYFSSDGGRTEDAVNAWGTDYPYLKGKADPYEASISFNGKSWSYQVTPEALRAQLQKMGRSCGTVTGFAVTATTAQGNVNEVTVTDSSGQKFVFRRDDVRFLQNLPGVTYMSRNFTIRANSGDAAAPTGSYSVYDGSTTVKTDALTAMTASGVSAVSGTVTAITGSGRETVSTGASNAASTTNAGGWTLSGGGYGHNIGMSQWGAYAMGAQGFDYREILQFYYTGITIQ